MADQRDRDKHRDNDDMRDPISPDQRTEVEPDTKSEARGDARDAAGNTARGTDFSQLSAEENDRTKGRPAADEFDQDL